MEGNKVFVFVLLFYLLYSTTKDFTISSNFLSRNLIFAFPTCGKDQIHLCVHRSPFSDLKKPGIEWND